MLCTMLDPRPFPSAGMDRIVYGRGYLSVWKLLSYPTLSEALPYIDANYYS